MSIQNNWYIQLLDEGRWINVANFNKKNLALDFIESHARINPKVRYRIVYPNRVVEYNK